MSANIYYNSMATRKSVPTNGPSSFIDAMGRAFGEGTRWQLDHTSVPILRGMAAADPRERAYDRLLELLDSDPDAAIEVWAEH